MKKALKYLLLLLLLLVLYVAAVLVHGTLTDWKPEQVLPLQAEQNAAPAVISDSVLSFITWNLGYGGLGAESNFFYDSGNMFFSNGRMVRADKALVEKNIGGDTLFMENTPADFYLFQEVDYRSKRSYDINQFKVIEKELPGYASFFAPNYRAPRVPIPIFEPWKAYGHVESGLATYSRFQPQSAVRFQLPGEYPWPDRIFQLDRCAAVHRFGLEGGRELVVVNVHNSAYDKTGELKRQQMAFLKAFFLEEYAKGHYVIVGGDWNQCPPYFEFNRFSPGDSDGYSQINIEADFLPADWQWIYDPTLPTNRKVKDKYIPGESFITIIDFFLISPNVKVLLVKGIDQQFRFSDHQPVWMEVLLL